MNDKFISCDWGTTSFRLRLVDVPTLGILAEISAKQGVAATYTFWESQSKTDRISFYMEFLQQQIGLLEKEARQSLNGLIIIISGMASASIGMLELPYKQIPVRVDNADFGIHFFPPADQFNHTVVLVSGLCSANDVMRGEETMIAGSDVSTEAAAQLFIFPGTHSKHILVQKGWIVEFKTYMTGEVFDLLSNKSILAGSVAAGKLATDETKMFRQGVHDSVEANILNSVFHVRTNHLFGSMDKACNYHYLSGLLIGEELKDLKNTNYSSITIVSTGSLSLLYAQALAILDDTSEIRQLDAAAALIKGQSLIYYQHLSK